MLYSFDPNGFPDDFTADEVSFLDASCVPIDPDYQFGTVEGDNVTKEQLPTLQELTLQTWTDARHSKPEKEDNRSYPVDPDPSTIPFHDVKKSDYFYEPVLWAVENGITSGTSASKFSPNAICTRGQVVTFLWRAAGCPEPTSTVNPFSDVKASDYFCKAVLWAVENGITSGIGNGKFGPNNSCTRAQVATFLWRAQGQPEATSEKAPFTDVKSSDYFYEAVLWAVENGITTGVGDGKFAPNNSCTRGQIVTFLYRAFA